MRVEVILLGLLLWGGFIDSKLCRKNSFINMKSGRIRKRDCIEEEKKLLQIWENLEIESGNGEDTLLKFS